MPLAAIPLLFGMRQFSKGRVWVAMGRERPLLKEVATYVYSFFSHSLWPIYVPFAVGMLEPALWRRRVHWRFQVVGLAVGLYLLYYIVRFPVTAQVVERHIVYLSPHF